MESSFLSSSSRKSVNTLKNFDFLFHKTSERLATGLKVNRASDDPAAFFTAKALNDRASDLNRVLDSAGNKLGSVRTAEAGIRAIENWFRWPRRLCHQQPVCRQPTPRQLAV
jgi:flagellin